MKKEELLDELREYHDWSAKLKAERRRQAEEYEKKAMMAEDEDWADFYDSCASYMRTIENAASRIAEDLDALMSRIERREE